MVFHESRLIEIDDSHAQHAHRDCVHRNDLEDELADAQNLGDRRETWSGCSVVCCGVAASSGSQAPGSSNNRLPAVNYRS